MKNILKTIAIAAIIATGAVSTSCEDMMTVDTGDKAYRNAQDTLYSYRGIMRAMQDVAERQIILGEIRGDLVSSTQYTTDTLYAISNFENPQDGTCSMLQIRDYYNIINNCNFYIHYADTNQLKSNIKYMLPEYAQVKTIRAWAYLQLVKNYKEVPYITKPIDKLSIVENFDYVNDVVNKDNLIDKILEDGLQNFVDMRYPQHGGSNTEAFGTLNNGAVEISNRLIMIPVRVVLGDLYLLRGANSNDYAKAAQYYYEFLKREETPQPNQCYAYFGRSSNGVIDANSFEADGIMGPTEWGRWASTYVNSRTSELISMIPSSANAGYGQMLTRVADIFGYNTSSSQRTTDSSSTESNAEDEDQSSGAIQVTRTNKRQYAPSNAYQDVVNQQTYLRQRVINTSSGETEATAIENCDARYYGSVEPYTYANEQGLNEAYPLCCKAARGGTFYYTIPTYRKTLVWLRMAEAINRAGYPEFAFAILKDGINKYTLPTIGKEYIDKFEEDFGYQIYTHKTEANTFIYLNPDDKTFFEKGENGEFAACSLTDEEIKENYVVYQDTIGKLLYNDENAMYYVTDSVRLKDFNKFLDFSDDMWNETYGIHARGTGMNDLSSSKNIITNIGGNYDRTYYDYDRLLNLQLGDNANPALQDSINAVENIIVDELALETAFEGNRFTDLVRIAEHKNAAGFDGTEWLAKKIANRGTKAPTSQAAGVEGYNADLYAKLKNQTNWYFAVPK
ncbi:MAG: hypothetical protein K2H04_06795 [Bacteroidaceae bacterium]|nr:hypothetical protein [Bacteroidaceae bacterium]